MPDHRSARASAVDVFRTWLASLPSAGTARAYGRANDPREKSWLDEGGKPEDDDKRVNEPAKREKAWLDEGGKPEDDDKRVNEPAKREKAWLDEGGKPEDD